MTTDQLKRAVRRDTSSWILAVIALVAALVSWLLGLGVAAFIVLLDIVVFACGCTAMRNGGWPRGLAIAALVIAGLRLAFAALYFALVIARVLPVP